MQRSTALTAWFHEAMPVLWLTAACMGAACMTAGISLAEDRMAARSAGCETPGRLGAFTRSALDGNRKVRTYLLEVPSDYSPSRAYPLVFVFHGGGGSGAQSAAWGLQRAAGAASNAIFVFPSGINYRHEGIGWDDRPDGYDLPFFDNMGRDLEAAYCINPRQVFVAGFSWGGDFAIALACHRGDAIRAIAANSAGDEYKDTSNYLTYEGLPCTSHRHPPIRFVHAEDGDAEYPPPNFATTTKLIQSMNACSPASTAVKSSTRAMSCVSFNGCANQYIECSFDHGLGNVIPPNWAQDTWDFFSGHSP